MSQTSFEIPERVRDHQPSTITLRDYQQAAVESVLSYLDENPKGRPAIQVPTGGGKTVIFSEVAKRIGYPVLVLAHRDELLDQAAEKFEMIDPGVTVGKVKAERNQWGAEVVVASVQTLSRDNRLEQLPRHRFRLIIVDEAHHAPADSYQKILGYFSAPVLGVSATLERGDGSGLGGVFDELVFERDILWMIEQGYLCDIRAYQVELKKLQRGRMKISRGDYQDGATGRALSDAGAPAYALKAYLEHAADRKAICFTPTVELAHEFAEVFTEGGVPAAAVSAETPRTERRDIYRKLRSGEIKVIANAMVLTEGFDEPSVDCIIVSRPTLSRPLFIQMVGRGMRLYPGKADCLILDMVGATDAVRMVTVANLFGLPTAWEKRGDGAPTVMQALQQQQAMKIEADREIEAVVVDPFEGRKFRWVQAATKKGPRYVLGAGDGMVVLTPNDDGLYDVVFEPRRGSVETIAHGLDLGYAQGAAEDYVRKQGKDFLARKDAAWRKKPASDKQRAALGRFGITELPVELTAGEASDRLTEVIARRKARRAA